MNGPFDNRGGQGGGVLRARQDRDEVKLLKDEEPVFETREEVSYAEGAKTSAVRTIFRLGCGHNIASADRWGPHCWVCRKTMCVECAQLRACASCTRTACDEHSELLRDELSPNKRAFYCMKCARRVRVWKALRACTHAILGRRDSNA